MAPSQQLLPLVFCFGFPFFLEGENLKPFPASEADGAGEVRVFNQTSTEKKATENPKLARLQTPRAPKAYGVLQKEQAATDSQPPQAVKGIDRHSHPPAR